MEGTMAILRVWIHPNLVQEKPNSRSGYVTTLSLRDSVGQAR